RTARTGAPARVVARVRRRLVLEPGRPHRARVNRDAVLVAEPAARPSDAAWADGKRGRVGSGPRRGSVARGAALPGADGVDRGWVVRHGIELEPARAQPGSPAPPRDAAGVLPERARGHRGTVRRLRRRGR